MGWTHSDHNPPPIAKTTTIQSKPLLFLRNRSLYVGASVAASLLLILCALWSFILLCSNFSTQTILKNPVASGRSSTTTDTPDTTFYDDPSLSYSIGSALKNWDDKRQLWLKQHPFAAIAGVLNRVVVVTGSQPPPCENPTGDHLLLRLFKNKVDYCRIHGHDIFYNNAFLHRKMTSVWAKLPPLRAAMVVHPEAEWVLWLDSDAVITDMEFKLPLEKYRNHNFIINGWEDMIYEKKSWLGLNTGIFLIRNCQWSIDFLETWAELGPTNPNHENLKKIIKRTLTDKEFPGDEQSALVYLMFKEKEKWGEKVYIENEYSLSGYWAGIVDGLETIAERYRAVEAAESRLRRRRAEVVSERYGEMREVYLNGTWDGKGGWRRPFITHFTGCQPCSGHHDPSYGDESCWIGMEKALNFADNQVIRNYGFVHNSLLNASFVSHLEFDSPA